jgi:3-oxoacyl-[acyl-carrier protein] reductase
MDLKLKGKRALVLGASAGLGEAVARALAPQGARDPGCSRSQEPIRKAAQATSAQLAIALDLTKPGAGAEAVQRVVREWGGVDILVTNTGGPPKGSIETTTLQQWQEGFQSLWLSAIESIQAALPEMKKNGWGRLLLVTSAAAKEPMAGLTVSNGLRAGLLGLTKSASNEIAQFGITINALLPGYTDTERLRELQIPEDKITAQIPARRLGRPEEFAALATFLASEQAAYITGQAIACDGGYLRGI